MVGREIKIARRSHSTKNAKALLSVRNISLKHPDRKNDLLLKNISFNLNKGEILGIFGLMGAGRTELLESIFGLHPRRTTGNILVEGKQITIKSPTDAIQSGVALVPEDRKKDGLVLDLNVRTNICLTTLDNLQTMGLLNNNKEVSLAKKYTGDLKIKTSSDKQLAKNLSGGNQQKVVLAKWLATKPRIFMLDEPTRGIDINAKNEIYKLILQQADEGLGIIVVSSELPEILTVSDRILVMTEGSITAEFTVNEATEDNILKAAIPKTI
jgi:ribose transport system ATP-binding protein